MTPAEAAHWGVAYTVYAYDYLCWSYTRATGAYWRWRMRREQRQMNLVNISP